MSKKNFSGGFDSLLGSATEQVTKEETPAVAEVAPEENVVSEIRATFIVDKNLMDKMKAIAYWDRTYIKDVINEAFAEYIKKYEATNGEIKPMSKKK